MASTLLGFNKTFTLRRRKTVVKASGAIAEGQPVVIATGIPGAIQANVLSNLPPPGERASNAGLYNEDEFRLWFGDTESSVDVQVDDLIEEEGTSPARIYRVMGVVDEAGRGHHQYMRVTAYSQDSDAWVRAGDST